MKTTIGRALFVFVLAVAAVATALASLAPEDSRATDIVYGAF